MVFRLHLREEVSSSIIIRPDREDITANSRHKQGLFKLCGTFAILQRKNKITVLFLGQLQSALQSS